MLNNLCNWFCYSGSTTNVKYFGHICDLVLEKNGGYL